MTPDSVTLYVSSLAIATNTGGSPTGQLDLGDNEMLLTYGSGTDPMSTIYTDLQSGYNSGVDGKWNRIIGCRGRQHSQNGNRLCRFG